MSTRLVVDWIRCEARGSCLELLPEVLLPDDWGYPHSRDGDPRPVVPEAVRQHAERAVATCPRLALRLVEEPAARPPV